MQARSILMNWKPLRRTESILTVVRFLPWRHVLTLTRVAAVSVPIVAEKCACRGAGFSRFLQLVPGEGESQTTGKLCVLHFFCQLDVASLCNGRTKRK